MKMAFVLGSLLRGQPNTSSQASNQQNSAANAHESLFGSAQVLPNQENFFGRTSSPVYASTSVNQQHTFYWLYRHGQSTHPILPHKINYRANMYALHRLGVRVVFALNSVGSLDVDAPPGSHAVPDQLIDYSWGRLQTYFDTESIPEDISPTMHIDFTQPFSDQFRQVWISLFAGAGIKVRDGGVCAVTQGPRLESSAEIKRLRQDGCHYVNMTLCPEAQLARELGMHYLCSAFVVNWGAGMHNTTTIDISQCARRAQDGLQQFTGLIEQIKTESIDFEHSLG